MRPIHVVHLDKARPAVLLTRELVVATIRNVTVAPITTSIRGLAIEVPVGTANGLDQSAVINCDNITTLPKDALGRIIGYLLPDQEPRLAEAIRLAFDLE